MGEDVITRLADELWRDVRLAVRSLRAAPVATSVAVASLVLGIGANTAIFSLVDRLLLRALPVANPQRLVRLSAGESALDQRLFSYATFEEIRRHADLLEGAAADSGLGTETVTIGGQSDQVTAQFVSGDFFSTLGVPAAYGRMLTPADDAPGGGPAGAVVVIGHSFWRRRFGGATTVLGASINLGRVPLTIVGVAPPDFFGVEVGRVLDVAIPIRLQPMLFPSIPLDADKTWLGILLRLKPAASLASAAAALRAAQPAIRAAALPKDFPADFLQKPFVLAPASAAASPLRQRFERPLMAIFAVVALVLLMACANIANLLLARGLARRHELSVRIALGATRGRLIRQLLIESIVLAAIGGIGGLVFARWAAAALVSQLSSSTSPVAFDLSVGWRLMAFTAAAMIATSILFGIVPAVRATRVAPLEALKEQGRGAAGHGRSTTGGWLIVVQVALSLTIVVAAGLFVRTFERLTRASLGFDRDRTLVVTVTAPTVAAEERNPFYHRLVRAAAAVPGVAHAGGSLNPPLIGSMGGYFIVTPPGVAPAGDAELVSQYADITPGWLAAYGTAIHVGRDVGAQDTETSPPVMLVNEAFVRRFFPGRNIVGETFALTTRIPSSGDIPLGLRTVIGIVGDAVYRSVRGPLRPTIYAPLAQHGYPLFQTNFYIAVRSQTLAPALLTRSVAAALTGVTSDLTLSFRPVAEQVHEALAQDRLIAMLSGFFGALALLLASLGLYGVTAYTVTRRRTEIGIRMALGAAPSGIVRLVVSRLFLLVSIGLIIGTSISLWASAFVGSLLYGVAPRDLPTLVGAAAVLAMVATAAGWLPAWRAARVDPAAVLRDG